MHYDFDTLPSRKNTASIKWDMLKDKFEGANDEVLPFWVADMDFVTPQPIIDAISTRVKEGVFGYTMPSPTFSLTVSSWMLRRHQAFVDPSWVVYSPGVVPGLVNAIQALSEAGDGVIVQPPVYYPFFPSITDFQRELIVNPLRKTDSSYEIDFEDLEIKASLPHAKCILLCNPHNPVGRVFTRDELLKIVDICVRHDLTMIVDEIHADIVFKPYSHVSFLTLGQEALDRCIVLASPSKTFNLAGFQTAYAIIPNSGLRARFSQRAFVNRHDSINVLGETAMHAAYTECEGYVDELNQHLRSNRDYCIRRIESELKSLKFYELQGTYLLWIDVSAYQMTCDEIAKFFIDEVRIAVDYGTWFGQGGENFVRLNLACPKAMLVEAMDRWKKAHENAMLKNVK